ncbi:hypothetical protein MMA231_01072 [Asticcacaulis sp. MM231]|uniref:hypothetical protein n=1 Tax=Asticcacaulis sp. MM231 TaxID=3157666 RepID=UPI0032D5AF10
MPVTTPARRDDSQRRETRSLALATKALTWEQILVYAEVALTIFCILMFSNALIGPLFAPQTTDAAAAESDSAILRLMWLPVYGVTLALAAFRLTRFMCILPGLFMTGLLVGLCLASSYWSIAADITSRRTIAVAVTTIFGLYLAARYRGEDLVQIIAFSFALLAFGSFFVCICVPSLGIHNDINAGAWKGVWYEKNQMAAMMVLGFIAACASAYISPERRRMWIGLAITIFVLVILSRSKTSLLACMASALAIPVLMALQRGGVLSVIFVWLAATAALVGGTLFYVAPEVIFKALGKDPNSDGPHRNLGITDATVRQTSVAWLRLQGLLDAELCAGRRGAGRNPLGRAFGA